MITALSLNPSIDRTVELNGFTVGGLNRVQKQTDTAAGKGVNVALAAAALGVEAECIGFNYEDGQAFEERLSEGGAGFDFIQCPGKVRVNLKLFDRTKEEITEINSSGTPVTEDQLNAMTELVRRHAKTSDYFILSGSMPPGCPDDYYCTLAKVIGESGCKVILDADGEKLRLGIKARPYMIKPNRYELEQYTGKSLDTIDKLLEAANGCIGDGVSIVSVSMGGDGALITNGRKAWRSYPAKIEIRSTVAAGDSMVAGLAAGFFRSMPLEEAFRLGVAAASVRCATPPEKIIVNEVVERICGSIRLEKIW